MKYFFFIAALLLTAVLVQAQNAPAGKPMFTWDLLWAGSWEENKALINRGDFRLGATGPGLSLRAQALDKRTLNFKLEQPFGDPAKAVNNTLFGLYHKATGSRLLYGVLDEWGLPARIRSPWIRSAPYTENHKPIMADLKTGTSSTKNPETYLYLSGPAFTLFDASIRGFTSAQVSTEGELFPAFSGGLSFRGNKNSFWGDKFEMLLEGFYTGAQLSAKQSTSWFSDPPPLPDREFRLGAAALMIAMPYFLLASDWAWSETFAYGNGVYGNVGIRLNPPLLRNNGGKPGGKGSPPWSLSLAADGMGERYVGRDGTNTGGGFRTAGKVERKGPRSSLFRVNTSLRSAVIGDDFNRSSSGIYYRFPAQAARNQNNTDFPLRLRRISFNADRNASDLGKIHDSVDGTLGLSLSLPPMLLPPIFLPSPSGKTPSKNPRPKMYPLSINFSSTVKFLGSAVEPPSPYPFFSSAGEFESAKTSCEILWSPGIFQLRTRLAHTAFEKKDDLWEASFSTAIRFKRGRFSAKAASPDFPEKWNYTISWRLEK
jgi:hypothetical protein